MLLRSSLDDLKSGKLVREPGRNHIVVAMQKYPRFVRKESIDEYRRDLSPEPGLFAEYRGLCVSLGDHEAAFREVRYEERFDLGAQGLADLERLSAMSRACNVHLLCRCGPREHCPADLVLLLGERLFGARIPELPFGYERFRARLGRKGAGP